MSTRYEYYNTGDDSSTTIYGSGWSAQTFTPSITHKITSVKLLLGRLGLPGTITVSIKATDGSGHPTGEDLCSGTTDGNTLPTGIPYEWREITLGDGYDLSADAKYAIVVRAIDELVIWLCDATSPTYAGGNLEASLNSGSSWTSYNDYDCMFEEWGGVAAPTVTTNPATNITSIAARLNGTVADDGGEACEYRFRYKVSGGSYTNTTWAGSVETDATFYEDITSLTAGATYYFNAQLKNTAGESAWGDEESFTTMKVATNPATHIEATTARLNGTVTSEGGEACQYRFRYRKALTSDSYTNTTWTGSKETSETFYGDITSLTEDTSYEFAAQIKNTAGESDWGTTLYFKTGTHSYTMPPVFDDHGRIPKGARVQARRADTGVVVETRYLGVDGQATFTDLPNDTGITFLTQWGGTTHCSQLVHSTIIGVAEGGTGASDALTARTNLGAASASDLTTHDAATTGVHGAGSDHLALFGVASTVVTKFTPKTTTTALWRSNLVEDSSLEALINGNPTSTSVVYDTDVRELSLPDITGFAQWGKTILHNITRGNSREITGVNLATNTITTEASTDDWADNDVITTGSQTCVNAGAHTYSYLFDIDVSDEVPTTATVALVYFSTRNLSGIGAVAQDQTLYHPFETYAVAKLSAQMCSAAYQSEVVWTAIPIVDQKICVGFGRYGAVTGSGMVAIVQLRGYWE